MSELKGVVRAAVNVSELNVLIKQKQPALLVVGPFFIPSLNEDL
jgi:hypothetical protein